MNDRPTAGELLEAVAAFLQDEAVPAMQGAGKFQARVAANVVRIVARELLAEDEQLRGEWERLVELLGTRGGMPTAQDAMRAEVVTGTLELVQRIRAGDADTGPFREAVMAHLEQTVADKMAVAKPPRG